jgi:predicted nucleic acid-binding protein
LIYVDSSVALAHLLAEDRSPPDTLWQDVLISSRLLAYEIWNRVNAHRLHDSHGEAVRALLARVAMVEMTPPVLSRAIEPFPVPVRTLDALHLAAVEFLRGRGQRVALATYDRRMAAAARAIGVELAAV